MPEFCTCGAQLPPDARFCHKCGKPQYDYPGITEETVEPAPPPVTAAPAEPAVQPPLEISFHNRLAVRIGFLAALMAVLPFMLLLPLAIYGGWRMARDGGGTAVGFMLWWMLAPVALVMAVSYAFTPFEEMRYVISSVAAFFILAGIGLAAIDSTRLRLGLLALIMALSLDHVRRDFIKPRYVQWREATALALVAAPAGVTIAVAPGYAVNVVRYYLPPGRRASVEAASEQCEMRQRVLILSGAQLLPPAQLAALRNCDPLVVGQLRLVEVRKR